MSSKIVGAAYLFALGFASVASFLLILWIPPVAVLTLAVLGAIAARWWAGVGLAPHELWENRKAQLLVPLASISIAVACTAMLLYGFLNLDRCHRNVNCDPDVLVVPLIVGYFFSLLALIWTEVVCGVHHLIRR